jgi:signal transduction histidine kinase
MEQWELLLEQLRAELTLREAELDLLHQIDLRLLDPDQSAQAIFSFIVKGAQKLLRSNHTTVLMRRSTFLEPMYSNLTSVIGQRVPISGSLTGLSLEEDRTINIPDLIAKPHCDRYAPLRGYRGGRMRSLLATPIRIRGAAVGVLNAESREIRAFQPVHERMAAAVAAQIAIALEQTQTLASTELFADVDRLIFADSYTHDDDADEAIADETQKVIQEALKRVMGALQNLEHVQHHRADILFLRGDELEIMHSTKAADVGLMVPVGNSISGRAIREKRTIIVGDVTKEPEYQLATESIRSEIAVPILLGEDDDLAIGVLNVESTEEDAFYGFYQVVLESFAEKVKTLLAFAKLRADVTEALELRTANEVLAAVGDQTSHIVHRLNNTVGAMRVRIIDLQRRNAAGKLNGTSFLTESLDSLRRSAERTLRMPSEVIQALSPAGGNVDVNESVQRALRQTDPGDKVQVILRLGEGMPALPLQNFDIVVQNLIQNALDAMPNGGSLVITTSAVIHQKLAAGYFQLTVKDNGAGIPPEIRKRIFELNFTTKGTRGAGRGLGLWWVRKFVRSAKGDISIRSTPGSGTEVTVKIPVEPAAEAKAAASAGRG